jgi:hypothetical protein
MPAKPLSQEQAANAVALVEDCLKEGFAPPSTPRAGMAAMTEAGRRFQEQTGLTPKAFATRISTARDRYGIEPDWSLWRAPQYQQVKGTKRSPNARAPIPESVREREGEPIRVLVIGDTHDDPRHPDKSRFESFGRMAAERKVDRVVQIGDFGTWDSVSRHEDRSTIAGRALPSFEDDMASCRMALMAFQRGMGDFRCPLHIPLGNHEDRVRVYENLHPVMEGGMYRRLLEMFAQYRWETRRFGEFLFIDGVGFCHVPLNIMGRPYGGKNPENQIGNDATFSLVYGHTHKKVVKSVPKIGPTNQIKVVNVGCGLPFGHVEDYAKLSTTGWDYGVMEIAIQGGQIISEKWFDMLEVLDRYGEPMCFAA